MQIENCKCLQIHSGMGAIGSSMKNESDSTQIHHTHTKKEWKNKIMPRAKKKKAECVFCNIILYAVMPRACTKDRRVWDGQGLLTEF